MEKNSSGFVGGYLLAASVSPQSHFHLRILAVGEVGRLDRSRRPGRGSGHVMAVVTVVVVMVVMVVEVRRLAGRAPVRPLLLVEIAHALVVTLKLVTEESVFFGGAFLVILETTDAVQPLKIDPSTPHHAHAVHDQPGSQVHLQTESSFSSPVGSRQPIFRRWISVDRCYRAPRYIMLFLFFFFFENEKLLLGDRRCNISMRARNPMEPGPLSPTFNHVSSPLSPRLEQFLISRERLRRLEGTRRGEIARSTVARLEKER